MIHKRATEKGSSLVEVMMSIVILGIIVTSLAFSFAVGSNNITDSRSDRGALKLAQDMMERLKRRGFNSQELTPGAHDDVTDANIINQVIGGIANSDIEWDVTNIDDADVDPNSDYRMVNLTATVNNETVNLRTLIGRVIRKIDGGN